MNSELLWDVHMQLNSFLSLTITLHCIHLKIWCSSGKCQIIHWRQGHKDECQLSIGTMEFQHNSDLDGEAMFHHGNILDIQREPLLYEEIY